MKHVSPELAQHLGSDVLTLARLLKIVRKDGTVILLTDHDTDIQYSESVETS